MGEESNVYYFGCWRDSGHYLKHPGGSSVHSADEKVRPWKMIDGCLPPARRDRPDRRGYARVLKEAGQGKAALHYKDGWTAIAFWDRSVDKRGASNSAFFVRGTHSWEDAVRIARKHFPSVWKRFPFEVVLYQEANGMRPEGMMSIEEKAADYDLLRGRMRKMEARLLESGLEA